MVSSRLSRLRMRSKVSREGAKPRSSGERRTILATPFRDVLRWRAPVGRAQADAGAVQVGADVTKAVQASAEKASDVEAEPLKVEAVASAIGPQPEEPGAAAESQPGSAAKLEGRKRGRPKKAESEGKAEAKPGKRQKTQFDF